MRQNRFLRELKQEMQRLRTLKYKDMSQELIQVQQNNHVNTIPPQNKHPNKKSSSKQTKRSIKSHKSEFVSRSRRINKQLLNQDQQFIEIDKQPFFNVRKRDLSQSKNIPKKSRSVLLIYRQHNQNKFEYSPVYEFEGMGYKQTNNKIQISQQQNQNQKRDNKIEEKGTDFRIDKNPQIYSSQKLLKQRKQFYQQKEEKIRRSKKQKKIEKKFIKRNNKQILKEDKDDQMSLQQQNIEKMMEIQNLEKRESSEGIGELSKMEESLLQIVKIIDEYFIFQKTFRPQRAIKLKDVLHYVNQVRGYFCSQEMFTAITQKNEQLYQILTINRILYIKSPKLTDRDVEKRQRRTKKRLLQSPITSNFMQKNCIPIE